MLIAAVKYRQMSVYNTKTKETVLSIEKNYDTLVCARVLICNVTNLSQNF